MFFDSKICTVLTSLAHTQGDIHVASKDREGPLQTAALLVAQAQDSGNMYISIVSFQAEHKSFDSSYYQTV
eukprot:5252094-Amphidinium_carterae.1